MRKGERMRIEIIGVYRVEEAAEPCHLVELWVREPGGQFEFDGFTQEMPGQPRENWQAAWDERILNSEGTCGDEAPPFPGPVRATTDTRVAFFIHYLDLSRPLATPAGTMGLPEASPRPPRLNFITYEAPG